MVKTSLYACRIVNGWYAAGCAHNPTGIDPTKEQWGEIADICIANGHIPFFDVAYQGFATGSLDEDAWAPRFFVEKGLEIFVAQSYSKNLGLYAERIGAINVVCEDKDSAVRCDTKILFVQLPASGRWEPD
jgi:aspartate aminotransferase, chloroplastic